MTKDATNQYFATIVRRPAIRATHGGPSRAMECDGRRVPSLPRNSAMQRLKDIATAVRDGMPRPRPLPFLAAIALAATAIALYQHPPLRTVARGEVALRENLFSGEITQWRDGSVLVVPGVHRLKVFSVRDRVYRPVEMASAQGPQPLQSQEGLSLGLDMTVRYALDPARLREVAPRLPEDIDGEV